MKNESHILKDLPLGTNLDELYNKTIVDSELSLTSENPIQNKVISKRILYAECFQFEVFPTNMVIPAGTKDTNDKTDDSSIAKLFDFDNTTATGLTYLVDVPVGNAITFELDSSIKKEYCDIVIDWGDGTVTNTATDDVSDDGLIGYSPYDGGYEYDYKHVYTDVNKKYVVSVYGNNYDYTKNLKTSSDFGIISRLFDVDLLNTIKHKIVLTSTCAQCQKLLKVEITASCPLYNIVRFSSVFYQCRNLQIVNLNGRVEFLSSNYLGTLFNGCENLKTSSFRLPPVLTRETCVYDSYQNCKSLTSDVLSLLPAAGFATKNHSMGYTFNNCAALTCSNYDRLGKLLWNDPAGQYYGTSSCFYGCSDNMREHIPYSWGGGIINGEFDLPIVANGEFNGYSLLCGSGKIVSLSKIAQNNVIAQFVVRGGTNVEFGSNVDGNTTIKAGRTLKQQDVVFINDSKQKLIDIQSMDTSIKYTFNVKWTTIDKVGKVQLDFVSE